MIRVVLAGAWLHYFDYDRIDGAAWGDKNLGYNTHCTGMAATDDLVATICGWREDIMIDDVIERTPDGLAAVGRALFGAEWQTRMADALGVHRQSIRRWLNGQMPLPPSHGVWDTLIVHLE